ncbi:MAG: beta-galactosidase [Clostridia bacterium]|nr:beta-galactosidase [Clostridia bacterium]
MRFIKCILLLLCFAMITPAFSACTPQKTPPADSEAETSATVGETAPETDIEIPTDTNPVTDAVTESNTSEENPVPVEPISINERYFIFRIWNFTERSLDAFKSTVNTAAADGFNAIKVHIPWYRAESTAGVYDYAVFDDMIDYVVKEKGLKVAISLDLTRRKGDTVLSEDDIMRDPSGNLCMGGSETGDRLQISFNSESAVSKAVAFYKNAVAHYHERYGDSVLFYLPAFSQYAETEYWCAGEYDYSDNAVNAFHAYLKKAYGTVDALNTALSANYGSFDEIDPPSGTAGNALGQLWYMFRHESLKAVIDQLALAQKEVAQNTKFAIQVGCVYDTVSILRGTFGIAELAEHADVVWIDDGPKMNHHFSMDYIRSVLPATVELAQEIDGPYQAGATTENYLSQGLVCFERGCTYVSAANWNMDEHYEAYRSVWQEIAATWLGDNPPVVIQPNENTPTLEISLLELFRKRNADKFIGEYLRLTQDESFVYIKIVDDLTSALPAEGAAIYAFPGSFSSEQGVGNWYYKTLKRNKLVDMIFDAANNRWQGDGDFNLIMNGTMHPDAADTALIFKAPKEGEITCEFSLALASGDGDGVIFYIQHNGEKVKIGDARNDGILVTYDAPADGTVTLTIAEGDEIAFVINKNSTTSYDSTAASVIIEYN